MREEIMLSVCEIARKLGRSERYVYQIKANAPEVFRGGRAFFCDILNYLDKHPSPTRHAKQRYSANLKKRLKAR